MFLPNVGYYQNKVVRIDNVDFILSTLWSRIPPVNEIAIQSGMNDYAQILYNKRRLIPQNINDEFERNLAFIKQAVDDSDAEKIVVVTHHLPTFAAFEDKHKGSVINAAYATELGNYIADSRISAWIYGHSHHNNRPDNRQHPPRQQSPRLPLLRRKHRLQRLRSDRSLIYKTCVLSWF